MIKLIIQIIQFSHIGINLCQCVFMHKCVKKWGRSMDYKIKTMRLQYLSVPNKMGCISSSQKSSVSDLSIPVPEQFEAQSSNFYLSPPPVLKQESQPIVSVHCPKQAPPVPPRCPFYNSSNNSTNSASVFFPVSPRCPRYPPPLPKRKMIKTQK